MEIGDGEVVRGLALEGVEIGELDGPWEAQRFDFFLDRGRELVFSEGKGDAAGSVVGLEWIQRWKGNTAYSSAASDMYSSKSPTCSR